MVPENEPKNILPVNWRLGLFPLASLLASTGFLKASPTAGILTFSPEAFFPVSPIPLPPIPLYSNGRLYILHTWNPLGLEFLYLQPFGFWTANTISHGDNSLPTAWSEKEQCKPRHWRHGDMSSGEGGLQQCLGAAHHSAMRQEELQKAEVSESMLRGPESAMTHWAAHVNKSSQQAEKPLLPSQMPLQWSRSDQQCHGQGPDKAPLI